MMTHRQNLLQCRGPEHKTRGMGIRYWTGNGNGMGMEMNPQEWEGMESTTVIPAHLYTE